jgi:Tol biopolymer transport system component
MERKRIARATTLAIGADGRYIVFSSDADNLVSGDTNEAPDIFIHDLQTGTTTRLSIASDGTEGNDGSGHPALSGDGRYVAFTSPAENLTEVDPNGDLSDVFIHDRQTGTTRRVSVASDGSTANDQSETPALSADGRHVAFYSEADNLVSGDTNQASDIFVHERIDMEANEAPRASADWIEASAVAPRLSRWPWIARPRRRLPELPLDPDSGAAGPAQEPQHCATKFHRPLRGGAHGLRAHPDRDR